ncbi:MAG: putative transmembrane protein [Podila humilis]|nr:MAG: putative transmembrane protein [Podila humilis]
MRHRDIDTGKVTNMELFFDLVYVYAISAISETMVDELSWVVILEMLVITLAIWWSWVFTAWLTNWFNPDSYLVRLLLLFLMLASLILSAVIPRTFQDQSLVFGLTYAVLQLARSSTATLVLHGHKLQKVFVRMLTWQTVAAVFWIVGGAIGGTTRNIIWAVAVVIEYSGPMAGFYTPGCGKSLSTDWEIHGGHLAERCSLFIIIALGESIVVTGESFKDVLHEPAGIAMFIVSFLGAAAMWWIYFHSASNEAIEYVESSDDPGAMGRMAYTYIHFVMVLGIIWCAVADRLSIDDPYHLKDMVDVLIIIGGPCLFVLGHALFRRSFAPRFPKAHLTAIVAMLCVTPICVFLPRWATAVCTTGIMMLLALYESYFRCVCIHKSPIF